jgi:hypothetical protein
MISVFRVVIVLAAVLSVGFWADPSSYADSPRTEPVDTVLLLYNGNVVSGKIRQDGDHYWVKSRSAKIKIRADQVELACGSVEEGYQQKHAAVEGGGARGHLDLAHWCLRQRLFQHAETELQTARTIEPGHPRIAVLERHLAMTQPSNSPTESPPKRKAIPRRIPSTDDLNTMVRSLPDGVMESFATTVQPVLLNHCATVGCHAQSGDNHLQLERMPVQRHARRRPTVRNLHAILKLIRSSAPDRSPLLTYPIRSHGGVEEPVFTHRNAAPYQHLVEWVQKLSGDSVAEATIASVTPRRTSQAIEGPSPPANLKTAPAPLPTELQAKRRWPSTGKAKPLPGKLRQPQSVSPVSFDRIMPAPSRSAPDPTGG